MPNPNPVHGYAEEEEAQGTLLAALQSAAVANGNGSVAQTDGFNGTLQLLIPNGAGTCTVVVEGSLDNFQTAQDVQTLGVYKLGDSGAGTNLSRTIQSGSIAAAANVSALYSIADAMPYIRARIASAAGLGAGTNVTGCTVQLYGIPM